jgi:hypothetical protein
MRTRSLLQLLALALVFGCYDHEPPTAVKVAFDPSKIIGDGAHGGNPDFFFLPPLVPNPVNDPNFERGRFNNALQPNLAVEICELVPEPLNALPTPDTHCVSGDPLKTFAPGTVRQVGLPQNQPGWWTVHNLPADGFYFVLWDTQQSYLDLNKFYRIKVLVDIGSSRVLLGVADVDPMSSMREWRHTLTGQVIQVIDDRLLPIPFRIEQGALCYHVAACTEAVVTNDNPTGDYQIVRVLDNSQPIAGALFPDGWLPPGGPQSVVVTISRVNTGVNNPAAGTQTMPCHANLPLQQFDGCFNFATFPRLQPINAAGDQFQLPVTTAVCFTLVDNTADLREPFVQLWASGPTEPAHRLVSVADALILTSPTARNCNTAPPVIGANETNAMTRFASGGWQKLKGGLGRVLGVQTAYAVDLGLGGLTTRFSNIGPALTAEIQRYTSTGLTLGPGATTTSTARIVGTQVHNNGGALNTGIGGLPVTFTVAAGNGTLRALGSEAAPATEVTVITNTNPINPESPVSGGGFAPVNWTMPTTPGTYTLSANGPATGGPVTFTATVVAPTVVTIDGVLGAGEWTDASVFGPFTVNLPGGGSTTATLLLKNTSTQLLGALQFSQNLSGHNYVIAAVRMDGDANGSWDHGEDGFVVQQRIAGSRSDGFFDEFFSCNVSPCQGQLDTAWGGTNDGVTASTDGINPTVIEFAKGINNADPRDAVLTPGQILPFFLFTNIGVSTSTLVTSYYPATGWASYTVR